MKFVEENSVAEDGVEVREDLANKIEGYESLPKRLGVFLRSVMPKDPWQLLFLVGTIFLFITPRLSWTGIQSPEDQVAEVLRGSEAAAKWERWRQTVVFAVWPIILASIVAYYSCFCSAARPLKRLWLGVLVPVVCSFVVFSRGLYLLEVGPRSLLDSQSFVKVSYNFLHESFWKFPPAMHVCLLGVLLVSIFTLRMHLGAGTLPLQLATLNTDDGSWNRTKWMIFILVGPLFLIAAGLGIVFAFPYLIWGHSLPTVATALIRVATSFGDAAILVGIAVAVLARPALSDLKMSLRLPSVREAFGALLLPVGLCFVTGAVGYLLDRTRWAQSALSQSSVPELENYFSIDALWNPWLLLLVLGAFAEEIVFRGLLLPRLIRHFDLHRGIFFTGIIWAAIHFRSDLYSGLPFGGVLYHLGWRVAQCLAWNYIFCWMTLRWRSVLPGAIAHAVGNILVSSIVNREVPWSTEIWLGAWAVAALLLLQYWPIEAGEITGSETTA